LILLRRFLFENGWHNSSVSSYNTIVVCTTILLFILFSNTPFEILQVLLKDKVIRLDGFTGFNQPGLWVEGGSIAIQIKLCSSWSRERSFQLPHDFYLSELGFINLCWKKGKELFKQWYDTDDFLVFNLQGSNIFLFIQRRWKSKVIYGKNYVFFLQSYFLISEFYLFININLFSLSDSIVS
jgi:hypothetical protein